MRVITGLARGRKLKEPQGFDIRPTTDRVKEAIFNICQFDLEGRRVLDLFGGTGQLGIEAKSRGAAQVDIVDASRDSIRLIRENVKSVGLEIRVVQADALVFLQSCGTYDLIFLDPPYDSGMLPKALRAIASGDLASPGATLVCETDCDVPSSATRLRARMRKDEDYTAELVLRDVFGGDEELAARYTVLKSPLYGRTRITLLAPRPAEEASEPEGPAEPAEPEGDAE